MSPAASQEVRAPTWDDPAPWVIDADDRARAAAEEQGRDIQRPRAPLRPGEYDITSEYELLGRLGEGFNGVIHKASSIASGEVRRSLLYFPS